MDAIHMHRIDASQRMARFYSLAVDRDLFGGWRMTVTWGRIGARRGQARAAIFGDEAAAVAAMVRKRLAKLRRGYRAV